MSLSGSYDNFQILLDKNLITLCILFNFLFKIFIKFDNTVHLVPENFLSKIYNFIAAASLIFYCHSIADFAIVKLCKHDFFLCFVFVKILLLTGSHV